MAVAGRRWLKRLHFPACLATMGLVSALVFSPWGQPWVQPYCLMPSLAWAAVRFTWRGTLPALALMLAAASIGTNPYAMRITDPAFAGFVLAQALTISAGFGLALAFVISMQRHAAARLHDLMETVDLGIFMTRELSGTILFWSKGAERLYGWTAAEAVGRISHHLLQTVHPIPVADIEQAVMTKGEWVGDLCHVTKDGRQLIVFARKVRRDLTNGHVITLLEVLQDVTVERADQAALADLNRTLEQRIEAEIAVREEAQKRIKHAHHMQALGKISAGVAHEFNNILQAVVGGLSVILAQPDDAGRVARIGRIVLTATDRGSVITSRLLGFAGRAVFRVERVEPALVLDALRDVLVHTLGGKVTVRLDIKPLLPVLVIDKSELETALINLATNARDAMADGGTITMSAQVDGAPPGLPAGRYLRFSVRDSGVGMDAGTIHRAVEPFFTTKAIGAGTGLGLSMVKGFAEQAGGALAIESAPGAGTTVTFWLPLTAPVDLPALPQVLPLEVAMVGNAGARVLLVDDEAMVRDVLMMGLEDAGFVVLTAASGAEALAKLDADAPIDVLVTDYAMPGMDGVALIRQARTRRPDLPCMVLTGYVESVHDTAAPALGGALTVLRKPVDAQRLASSINAALHP